jgi:hypothetical protein
LATSVCFFFVTSFDDLGHHTASSVREVHAGDLREAVAVVHVLVDVGEPEQRPVQDPLLDDWIILVEDVPEDLLVEGDRLAPVPHPDDSALKLHLALQAVHGVDQRKALKVSGHVSSQGSLNVLSTLIVIVHEANVSQLSEIIRTRMRMQSRSACRQRQRLPRSVTSAVIGVRAEQRSVGLQIPTYHSSKYASVVEGRRCTFFCAPDLRRRNVALRPDVDDEVRRGCVQRKQYVTERRASQNSYVLLPSDCVC